MKDTTEFCYTGFYITKDVLDTVEVGDLVKCNGWKVPYRVKGVSENYFVMARKQFGEWYYSICEKKLRTAGQYNAMMPGMFHISVDNMVFGYADGYGFDNAEWMAGYLDALETGKIELSERKGCALNSIHIKKG